MLQSQMDTYTKLPDTLKLNQKLNLLIKIMNKKQLLHNISGVHATSVNQSASPAIRKPKLISYSHYTLVSNYQKESIVLL